MTRKQRKLTTDKWLIALASINGPGSLIIQFDAAAFVEPWCRSMRSLAKTAKSLFANVCRLRLVKLIGCTDDTFRRMTDIGVVAGGAVIYALNDFVPANSVNNVDIFIFGGAGHPTAIDVRRIMVNDLSCTEAARWFCKLIPRYPNSGYIQKVLKICYRNPYGKYIDLIMNPYDGLTARAVVQDFDFDYTRCYFHRGAFGGTRAAQIAHRTRTVRVHESRNPNPVLPNFRCSRKYRVDVDFYHKQQSRIKKIRRKGFRIELFGEPNAPRRVLTCQDDFCGAHAKGDCYKKRRCFSLSPAMRRIQ